MNGKRSRRASLIAGIILPLFTFGLLTSSTANAVSPRDGSGNVVLAEGQNAYPDYIFPFYDSNYCAIQNQLQFQQLMYRPLYVIGAGTTPTVNEAISPAFLPTYNSARTVATIDLKGWKFYSSDPADNGLPVNARSVLFFLNLLHSDPGNYCGTDGEIPSQLSQASASGNTLTLTFSSPVNERWLLYNFLVDLTPLPLDWDITTSGATAGSGGCGAAAYGSAAADLACRGTNATNNPDACPATPTGTGVEGYLDAQACDTTTYTDPMWQTVDGPWMLTSYGGSGADTVFSRNPHYSLSISGAIRTVTEVPYTQVSDEVADLQAGKLTYGYVGTGSLPGPAVSPTVPGPNLASIAATYTLAVEPQWGFTYSPFNFMIGQGGDLQYNLVSQTYIRQAMQLALNQPKIIHEFFNGYATRGCSPLPAILRPGFSTSTPCPLSYSPWAAQILLSSHGWRVEDGVRTCMRPGTGANQCGLGIAEGTKLDFSIGVFPVSENATTTTIDAILNGYEISEWHRVGISVSIDTSSAACDNAADALCWLGGWIYAPDYYPSGEQLLLSTAGDNFNLGSYSDPTMDAAILRSISTPGDLTAYASLAAKQVPDLYQPSAESVLEISDRVTSYSNTISSIGTFLPEYTTCAADVCTS